MANRFQLAQTLLLLVTVLALAQLSSARCHQADHHRHAHGHPREGHPDKLHLRAKARPTKTPAPPSFQKLLEAEFPIIPCGYTACDNPALMLGYSDTLQAGLIDQITLAYRYITIDKYLNNTWATQKTTQQQALTAAYGPAKIGFQAKTEVRIPGVYLQNTDVLWPLCDYGTVGDETCDPECNTTLTGFDAGDCNATLPYCPLNLIGNGQCDDACNFAKYNWDGGECCSRSVTLATCRDPAAARRAWIYSDDWKGFIGDPDGGNVNGMDAINLYVYPPAWMKWGTVYGASTYPFSPYITMYNGKYAGSILLGVTIGKNTWMNDSFTGQTLNHEMGHIMGLFHPFQNVTSNSTSCSVCEEVQPLGPTAMSSTLTGDLVADTRPIPEAIGVCKDPAGTACTGKPWVNTPFTNVMGYANDDCMRGFTLQQMARMRCYADLYLQSKFVDATKPSTIVHPPRVDSVNSSAVVLSWLSPLRHGAGGLKSFVLQRVPKFSNGSSNITVSAVSSTPTIRFSYVDRDVQAGVNYTYSVLAEAKTGGIAAFHSRSVNVTVPAVPPKCALKTNGTNTSLCTKYPGTMCCGGLCVPGKLTTDICCADANVFFSCRGDKKCCGRSCCSGSETCCQGQCCRRACGSNGKCA